MVTNLVIDGFLIAYLAAGLFTKLRLVHDKPIPDLDSGDDPLSTPPIREGSIAVHK
jgi:hypothetical protein